MSRRAFPTQHVLSWAKEKQSSGRSRERGTRCEVVDSHSDRMERHLQRHLQRTFNDDLCALVAHLLHSLVSSHQSGAREKKARLRKRINWSLHTEMLHEGESERYYRMSYVSFGALLRLVAPTLKIGCYRSIRRSPGVEPLSPEGILHCRLSWLAGGSYHHICVVTGVSCAGLVSYHSPRH